MTQVFKQPASPKQAARRRSRLDSLLDPELFRALADPTRSKLLACLIKCSRPCSVTEIAQCCDLDFSMVARHLATLARSGVLTANKQGRTVWYQAPPDLAARFRAIADAIDELTPTDCCEGDCCG
ncbi:MAG: winged helix-turn-helix transcriptional regulator [Phycisphaerales bacterium]|nr:winged helix-turn-helix transcriptional regulator [Phycisphaerales bacterium]MCB9837660.1 winged helix-turn-helix transcriptional regulator [Phycisphaera sp.]